MREEIRKFDTRVQHIKYKVLREAARSAWKDKLTEDLLDISHRIVPGKSPTIRCCVYKEREIIQQRLRLAMGGDKSNPNIIEVIDIACDECPMGGYEITKACRGCLAHRCYDVCKFGAITFDRNHVAIIDKDKCVECGACAKVCPYSAIINYKRPCERSCEVNAISMNEDKCAKVDNDKCIACGACVYQCPWGAIMDKSYILDAIKLLKNAAPSTNSPLESEISSNEPAHVALYGNEAASTNSPLESEISSNETAHVALHGNEAASTNSPLESEISSEESVKSKYNVYAIVAPSIASQFTYASTGQIVSGIKMLGFSDVMEVALGADIAASLEAKELSEKGFLTSSCCPSFVDYVAKYFPSLVKCVSHSPSPMTLSGRLIKEKDPTAKVVFIGPCIAKKLEMKKDGVREYIDCVITFEELQALFDSRDIDITALSESELSDASYYGRIFARSGGLSAAISQATAEQGLDFDVKPVVCEGISQCKVALLKLKRDVKEGNFIEGMVCKGGCIGGAGCLTHEDKHKNEIDKHAREARDKTITQSINNHP